LAEPLSGTVPPTVVSTTIIYAYDPLYRLISATYSSGQAYTYDDVGNVQTMVDSVGGLNLTYGYDELDRLTGVSGTYGRTYSYNSIGNLEVKNGLTLYYEDPNHPHAVSSTSEGWALDCSPTGNMITKTVGSQVVTFDYNAENRLTQVVSDVVGSVLTITFVYDGDGRRVKKVDESGTTVYVGEHYEVHDPEVYSSTIERVSVASDGTEGDGYSYWSSISADGRFVAFYSFASNLIVSDTNDLSDVFVHDRQTGETTRVSVASGGTEGNNSSYKASISADGRFVAFYSRASNLVVNDTNGIGDVFVNNNAFLSVGSATKRYYANSQRVATRVDGTLYYVHQDHLGSTVALSDADGVAMGHVQYDPYGEVFTSTLPVTPVLSGVEGLTDRLFTGQRFDSSTGLYYYNARYYAPDPSASLRAGLGRFIQPDSLVPNPLNPQAWNRFSYVYNNPINYVDPSGHDPLTLLLLCIAGGALAGGGLYAGHLYYTGEQYNTADLLTWMAWGRLPARPSTCSRTL